MVNLNFKSNIYLTFNLLFRYIIGITSFDPNTLYKGLFAGVSKHNVNYYILN